MMTSSQNIVHRKLNEGYSHFNFAMIHCRGLNHVFDTMRYESAFFARRSDVENILAKVQEGQVLTSRFSLLLCKYDWRGVTKPNWTPARLCGGMEFECVDEITSLYSLNSEITEFRPKKKLKIRSELEFTGTLSQILHVMYDNHALPENEGDAHRIEREFCVTDHQPITVKLVNYQSAETAWLIKVPA